MIERMAEQLLLPGIDPPPPPARRSRGKARPRERLPHSLFFAIFPNPQDAASLSALAVRLHAQHGLKGTPTEAHRLHVTLLEVGDNTSAPRDRVARALQAAATVAPPMFGVSFDQAMTFSNGAFVLCEGQRVSQIAGFRQRLGEALADAGFKPPRSFTPHMTLAYKTRRKIAVHPIEPLQWTAGSFALIDSHVGEGVHEVLGQWPPMPL